ncbi:hypothetical protein [Halomonas sp.]|uniref:hypothetical protein n=1 Tax=Halomonas sp. TaxID=1486246 RepID=UPI0038507C80
MNTGSEVMATLFIQGRQLQQWRLVGNTLSVRMHRRAEQLFPLSRLRRVIFIERAPGDMRYLWKLLEMGVGVTFLGSRGRLIGAFSAPAVESSPLPLLAERLMHDSSLRQWLAEWQDNQNRHLERDVLLQLGQQAEHFRHPLSDDARDWLDGLSGALLNDVAAEYQLDSAQRPARCLITTLHRMLLPWIMVQGRWWLRHRPAPDVQHCCQAFEAFSEPLEDHMQRMLVQLELRAEEWL